MAEVENPINVTPPDLGSLLTNLTSPSQSSSPLNEDSSPNSRDPPTIPSDAICRICRGPHSDDKPLYHPCLCSGSIKYIHEQCLAEWLSHSGQNKCEVCRFEFQYNLDWGSSEKNAKMVHVVRKRDFIFYFAKTLLRTLSQSVRIVFVITLWFMVFALNTILVSPFLPTQINNIFGAEDFPASPSNSTRSSLTSTVLIDGQFSFQRAFISVALGAVTQMILFFALCVFEFHHRHRDALMADFGDGNIVPLPPQNPEGPVNANMNPNDAVNANNANAIHHDGDPQNDDHEFNENGNDDDDDDNNDDVDDEEETKSDHDEDLGTESEEKETDEIDHNEDDVEDHDGPLREENNVNDDGPQRNALNEQNDDANDRGDDERPRPQILGIDVHPPDDDAGFLNPEGIRDARPIELIGLGGRFNAFFSTLISVTVFNIALISTIFWLPTIVGLIMTYSTIHFSWEHRVFMALSYCANVVYHSTMIQFLMHSISETLSFVLYPMMYQIMDLFHHGITVYFDLNLNNIWMITKVIRQIGRSILGELPLMRAFLTTHPMIFGYLTLISIGLLLLLMDMAYYHFKRPSIVKYHRYLRRSRSSEEVSSFWVLMEEISRIHTVFWRLIDSALRVYDFAFQLLIMPYLFGRGIALATRCIRKSNVESSTGHIVDDGIKSSDFGMGTIDETSTVNGTDSLFSGFMLEQESYDFGGNGTSIFERFNASSLIYILDDWLENTSSNAINDEDSALLRALEGSLLRHITYWMVGFWYVYGTMKVFSNARHLMRIEFNALWMRFPQPNQIPISLSIVRAMKERIISMRIHIPLILMGVHMPCRVMVKLFPSVFPVALAPINFHKWPTAGMLFMISCGIATVMRRLRVRRRWHHFARSWLNTVTFALGIQYLVVPGADPPDDVLLELDDPEAQRMMMEGRIGRIAIDHVVDDHGPDGEPWGPPFVHFADEAEPNPVDEGKDDNDDQKEMVDAIRDEMEDLNLNQETESMESLESTEEFKSDEFRNDDDGDQIMEDLSRSDFNQKERSKTKGIKPSQSLLAEAPETPSTASTSSSSPSKSEEVEETQPLQEEIKKLREENESLKAQIERKEKRKLKKEKEKRRKREKRKRKKALRKAMRKAMREKKKKKQRRDDIFLTPHPWENPNDVYLRLHAERLQYVERCDIYTVGTGHLRLRIFGFVLCLWITHILCFSMLFLVPLVAGRFVMESYLSTSWRSTMNNKDVCAYILGIFVVLLIPNEIHCILSYHLRGTLSDNMKRLAVRVFTFLFIPLFIGYGWNSMIYHFLHSVSVTPVYCLLELYCTGIYVTIIYLLFLDQHDLQNVLLFVQNRGRVDLRRFCRQFAIPTLRILIFHISLPIALRFWMMQSVNGGHQSHHHHSGGSFGSGAGSGSGAGDVSLGPSRSTVIIDLDSISNGFSEDEIDHIQRSVLQLEPILMNKVFLHYNHYELGLFLDSDIWYKLYQFVIVDMNWNLMEFLYLPFFENAEGVVITNWYMMYRFSRFVAEYVVLKCPIPFVMTSRLVWMLLNKFLNHIPKIKDIILQERYSGARKLLNLPANRGQPQAE